MTTPRCPKCGYALVRALCPMCNGRKVGDRLPMPAPLPVARKASEPRQQFVFARSNRRANARTTTEGHS